LKLLLKYEAHASQEISSAFQPHSLLNLKLAITVVDVDDDGG
jgi:hypothetical protein